MVSKWMSLNKMSQFGESLARITGDMSPSLLVRYLPLSLFWAHSSGGVGVLTDINLMSSRLVILFYLGFIV